MTIRKSSYRSIESLRRDLARCRACVEAGYALESLPVRAPLAGQRAYMYGQAPGLVEGQERLPWRGRAGQTLRRWLELEEDAFYRTFFCASVTRCYPGRAASGRGDRTPTPREQELCRFWSDWELELLRPKLIVTVGGLALRRLLGLADLTAAIGRRFDHARRAGRPAAASVGCEQLAECSGEQSEARRRARARSTRVRAHRSSLTCSTT